MGEEETNALACGNVHTLATTIHCAETCGGVHYDLLYKSRLSYLNFDPKWNNKVEESKDEDEDEVFEPAFKRRHMEIDQDGRGLIQEAAF